MKQAIILFMYIWTVQQKLPWLNMGQMVVAIFSAVAQAERQRIFERTIEGKKFLALHEKGIGATDIARQMGIG